MGNQNTVYGPANRPIFDPAGIRVDRRKFVGGSGITELPPFSFGGPVDVSVALGSYPVRDKFVVYYNIIEYACTARVGTSGVVSFRLYKNGVPYDQIDLSSDGLSTFATNIVLAPDDLISMIVSDPNANYEDVVIVCRLGIPTMGPVGPLII